MSLSSGKAAPPNVNHLSNQTQAPARNQHQQPSVQTAKGPQTPTEAEKSNQDTGNHTQVQHEQEQNSQANPLTSPQQSIHNQKIATGGV